MSERPVFGSVAVAAFARAVVVVAALNAVFLALAWWTATRPRDPLIARVKEAFASGELVDEDYLPLDGRRGFHQYNDCLILQMITNPDPQTWLNAVAPLVYVENMDTWEGQCATLHRLVEDGRSRSRYLPHRYARYWHGCSVIAAALLQWLSLTHVRRGLELAVYGGLAGLLAAAFGHRGLFAVATAIAVTGASVWAVPYFGQSLNDGPGDVFVLLGIGAFLFWRERLSALAAFIPFCAAYGAMMGYIEMFTGVTATAAGLLFPLAYVVTLSRHRDASAPRAWGFAIAGLGAFALGSLFTVAMKLVLSAVFLGQEAASTFLGHLKYYTSPHLGVGGRPSLTAPFAALLRQGPVLTYGSESGALLLYAGAALTWLTAGGLALRRRGIRPLSDLLAFAVGAAAMPLWVLLFPTHTVVHSWLNVRLLIVPISLGLAAVAWHLTAARGGRQRPDTAVARALDGPGSESPPALTGVP
jgi:hypothetical protein